MSRSIRRDAMIDRDHQQLSLVSQCILLDVGAGPRCTDHAGRYRPGQKSWKLMALMDRSVLPLAR